jgi:hypothetical protein
VTSIPAGGTDTNAGQYGLTHVITGLTNGTPYDFTFHATNGVGNSLESAASNSVTPVGLLIGTTSLVGTARAAAIGDVWAALFIALTTGNMVELHHLTTGSGNCKYAIYSDAGTGTPINLLAQTGSIAVTTGINIVPFPSFPIVSGTSYWLAILSDSDIYGAIQGGGGNGGFADQTTSFIGGFNSVFANSLGSSRSFNIAGYGGV